MTKKYYEAPEWEVEKFSSTESVMTTSGWAGGGDEYELEF